MNNYEIPPVYVIWFFAMPGKNQAILFFIHAIVDLLVLIRIFRQSLIGHLYSTTVYSSSLNIHNHRVLVPLQEYDIRLEVEIIQMTVV